jgi:hypothetical protein
MEKGDLDLFVKVTNHVAPMFNEQMHQKLYRIFVNSGTA